MKTVDSPDVYGYSIFCDDIRHEVGGKLTFVGTYFGSMYINGTFPTVLPKFAINIIYMQRRPDIVPTARFQIYIPGSPEDVPMTFELPDDVVRQNVEQAASAERQALEQSGERTYATFGAQLQLHNLVIPKPGLLRVRAVRGEELIRLGTLQIMQHPDFKPPQVDEAAN